MATSFTIAADNNGLTLADAALVTLESVRAYRLAMGDFAAMRTLNVWYAHMSENDIQVALRAAKKEATGGTANGSSRKRKGAQRAGKG
jgi:hypothetical protein